jgi:hypothetical protein
MRSAMERGLFMGIGIREDLRKYPSSESTSWASKGMCLKNNIKHN